MSRSTYILQIVTADQPLSDITVSPSALCYVEGFGEYGVEYDRDWRGRRMSSSRGSHGKHAAPLLASDESMVRTFKLNPIVTIF